MAFIDKLIGAVSPSWALKRSEARTRLAMNNQVRGVLLGGGSYNGVKNNGVMQNWNSNDLTSNSSLLPNVEVLRARSHDLYRNAPAARGAIKTIAANVIGSGLVMRSTPDAVALGLSSEDAREWADNAERQFELWAEHPLSCDFSRKMTFAQIQRLANSSQQLSGDVFVLMPWVKRSGTEYNLKLRLIDAARVCNPNDREDTFEIAGGIEYNEDRIPVAIHIRTPHPGDQLSFENPTWERIPYYGEKTGRLNILHIMEHEYIDQARGEPVLAPVIEPLQQISKYSQAELTAAVINAMMAVFIEKTDIDPSDAAATYDDEENLNSSESSRPDLESGTWIEGAPGEKATVLAATRPSAQFDPFFVATMKQIGMALEIPHEILMKQFTNSYSASRAAILEAWKSWKVRRNWLITTLCRPVYEEFLTEAVLTGRINAPGFMDSMSIRAAYSRANWVGPTQGQLDPTKEIEAANKAVESGFTTRSMAAAELNGQDFEQIVISQHQEKELCKKYGLTFGSEVFQPGVVTNSNPEEEE
ncbi:phage portal protein [Serratia sp. MF2]|uniref:phage portal protein n=1 Tax=Serratia sp. MF1(2023) TaxID=3059171 RepID=UPI002800626B|nr:phage portal protein [Serratia sp. MF1(2023)]MDQ7104199.1 phage portal protein [Serratia sp. MF1(2023)]